jgi:hypothetical protein
LLVGYVFTFPMNWMLLKIGWKHGMGPAEDAHPARESMKPVLLTAMVVLGVGALVVPAWLTAAALDESLRAGAEVLVPARAVVLGPARTVGPTMVMLPTTAMCRT